MNPDQEILRLQDLLPASWRMSTEITHKLSQKLSQEQVITSTPLSPWANTVRIVINFRLWAQLPTTARDLLLLREVSWRHSSKWFQPGMYQICAGMAAIASVAELIQTDPVGVAISLLLATAATDQIRRKNRGTQIQVEADNEALRVAQRRGYTEVIAAQSLLEAIQTVAKLEGRSAPEFAELIRCQNLRAIAGFSAVTVPLNQE